MPHRTPYLWVSLLFGLALDAGASTSKYRLVWHDDPTTTMSVGWTQTGAVDAMVYYGPADKGTDYAAYPLKQAVSRTAVQASMTHKFARLTGLKPNTAYYYVIHDPDGTSPRMWFKTAPADSNTSFSVVAGGDSRDNRLPRQRANLMVSKLRPLFVLFGGDMTALNDSAGWAEWWEDWQLSRSADGRMYPVWVARGNHESSNAVLENMFDTPSPNIYYAYDIGGKLLRVYTLNTEISQAGDQVLWLKKDLADHADRVWKIMQYHGPMRPHQSSKPDSKGLYDNWAGPIYDNRVNLVIECHAHVAKTTWPIKPSMEAGNDAGFVRDDKTGTVYVGEGTWGAPLRPYDNARAWTRGGGSFNMVEWIQVSRDKMTHRKVKVDNADSVGSVTDAQPFSYPAKLDVFEPATGGVTSFLSSHPVVSARPVDPMDVPGLSGLRLVSDRASRSRGESIRLLDAPSDARASVYDAGGKRVRELGPEARSGGALEWNGKTQAGRSAPLGRYQVKVSLKDGTRKTFSVALAP